jgi:hypothetical protein
LGLSLLLGRSVLHVFATTDLVSAVNGLEKLCYATPFFFFPSRFFSFFKKNDDWWQAVLQKRLRICILYFSNEPLVVQIQFWFGFFWER